MYKYYVVNLWNQALSRYDRSPSNKDQEMQIFLSSHIIFAGAAPMPQATFLGVHSTSARALNDPQARIYWYPRIWDALICWYAWVEGNAQTMLTHNHQLLLFYILLLDWI